jgi:hypothetical protein
MSIDLYCCCSMNRLFPLHLAFNSFNCVMLNVALLNSAGFDKEFFSVADMVIKTMLRLLVFVLYSSESQSLCFSWGVSDSISSVHGHDSVNVVLLQSFYLWLLNL